MVAYYNEFDPKKAAWLRGLVERGLIAEGVVDERSIKDVRPDELMGYTQCHFFAGIGVWSYALRLAGWPDSRPCWTGSAPCQPFSAAGKGKAFNDERHLWPAWARLIGECRPPVILGEEVASKAGRAWFDLVSDDLEGMDYAVGALSIPACGIGSPHLRQRLWFCAIDLDHPKPAGLEGHPTPGPAQGGDVGRPGPTGELGNATEQQRSGLRERRSGDGERQLPDRGPGAVDFWTPAEWLPCRDGKWRPIGPGIWPLVQRPAQSSPAQVADGPAGGVRPGRDILNTPEARVLRLRGYGDAIVAPLAAEFIKVVMEGLTVLH